MTDTQENFLFQYVSEKIEGQILFLSAVLVELTIFARDTYALDGVGVSDPIRLRAFNELSHKITSHLRKLLNDSPERYPDDVIGNYLWEAWKELQLNLDVLNELIRKNLSTACQ